MPTVDGGSPIWWPETYLVRLTGLGMSRERVIDMLADDIRTLEMLIEHAPLLDRDA